ncbi:MAG: hypothetical protein WCK58_05315, partial [Chloroflexota bacterium]
MSIEGILIGLLGIVLGLAFCFGGFRWFMLLLPVWGLFAGFTAGAGAVSVLLGESFLASILGVGVGVVLALVFALFSYLYWWGAVVVVAGGLGFAVTQLVLGAIGLNPGGLLVVLISIVGGAVVALVAMAANAPKHVAIVLTAVAGAGWLAAGLALMLGAVKTDALGGGALVAVYTAGTLWIAVWAIAAAAGIVAQVQMTR